MGETTSQPFQLSFNPALKVEFQGSRVTSDGGLILVRELDERLGFSDLIAQHITDPRGKKLFPRVGLIVTNLETDSRAVVRFYSKRGTAEAHLTRRRFGVIARRLETLSVPA